MSTKSTEKWTASQGLEKKCGFFFKVIVSFSESPVEETVINKYLHRKKGQTLMLET